MGPDGACANAVRDACDKSGAECIVLEIPRSALIDDDELAALLERQLAAAPHIKFALLDHITSPTAVVLPIARLVAICHSHGVEVMVDGAHAPGNVLPQLDIPAIGADWYTGNLHKWWCAHAPPLLLNLPSLPGPLWVCSQSLPVAKRLQPACRRRYLELMAAGSACCRLIIADGDVACLPVSLRRARRFCGCPRRSSRVRRGW